MGKIEQAIAFRKSEIVRLNGLHYKDFREFKREASIIRIEREIEMLESLLT